MSFQMDTVINRILHHQFMAKVNFREKFSKFDDFWAPKVVSELNDYQFKIVKLQGDFIWHSHADTDEAFIVIKGSMEIELRDQTVSLSEGEMFVVPMGVEHKPRAENDVMYC